MLLIELVPKYSGVVPPHSHNSSVLKCFTIKSSVTKSTLAIIPEGFDSEFKWFFPFWPQISISSPSFKFFNGTDLSTQYPKLSLKSIEFPLCLRSVITSSTK